ncbi:MAG: N-acetyltransferase [Bacteroidetes bacterium]|nr:MAG: N-acetyltransferase [Bacteroidota bacterium]
MDTFPKLYTPRLILRKMDIDDVPSLVKYANNPKISDNIVNIPYPYREPDAAFRMSFIVQGFKNKNRYVFSIESKERKELIGEISLHFLDRHNNHLQLAYWIGEPFWGQGLVTEAAQAVIKFGFEQLGADLIYADCSRENIGSQKVLLKNGMQQQPVKGDLIMFRITKEEFHG